MSHHAADLRDELSKRHYVLEALFEGPRTKPELVEAVGRSRSTIDRAVASFADHDCVVSNGMGTFRLTKKGIAVVDTYRTYVTRTVGLSAATEIINHSALEPSVDFITDMDVYVADSSVPELALERSTAIVQKAARMRGLAAAMLGSYPEVILAQVDAGMEAQIITDAALIESALELKPETMVALLEHEAADIRVTDRPIPESLWLTDSAETSHVGITVHAGGGVKGVLINDDPDAVAWGESVYEPFVEVSESVTATDW